MRADTSAQPRSSDLRIRGALLMPLCALAVHQARYYLAFGSHAGARLSRTGHGYLSMVEPLVLLTVALALGGFVGRLARVWQRPTTSRPPGPTTSGRFTPSVPLGLVRVWATCALVLLVIYCGQELFEGFFAASHPAAVAGIFGQGGWIAIPLATIVGAVLAATLRAAQTLVQLAAAARVLARARNHAPAPMALRRIASSVADWRLEPQSGSVAGRAPPLVL